MNTTEKLGLFFVIVAVSINPTTVIDKIFGFALFVIGYLMFIFGDKKFSKDKQHDEQNQGTQDE